MAQLSVPIVIQWIIDELTLENANFSLITKYSLYILGLGLLMAFFRLGWRYFIMGGARKIEYSLRNDFFEHIQKLNFDFFSGRKVGDLMAHTVNDIETLKFSSGLGLLIAYDGVFLFFFIFAAMIYISPEMALYAFLPFPALAVFIYKFGNMIESRFQRSQDSFSELTESARKPVSGIKVVKAFGLEQVEGRDFDRASADYLEKNVHLVKIRAGFQPFIYFVPSLAMALFLFFGGAGAIGTEITLGEFSAILVYLMMLAWPMMAMGWAIDLLKRGNASINRLNDIFAVEQKDETRAGEKDYELKGDIKFSGVSFSYGSTLALADGGFLVDFSKLSSSEKDRIERSGVEFSETKYVVFDPREFEGDEKREVLGIIARNASLFAELFPTRTRATAQGFCYNMGRGISAIAPPIIGYLAGIKGYGPALVTVSIFAFAAAIVVFALPETKGKELDI